MPMFIPILTIDLFIPHATKQISNLLLTFPSCYYC